MQFTSLFTILSALGFLAGSAMAWANDTITTTITTDVYTTYCPHSTTFTYGTKTYTATASETITITDCPCTYVQTTTQATPTSTPESVWITTTETVQTYTTYCPEPTIVFQGNATYTVTEATTLTITNCPCTRTSTIPAFVTYCPVPTTVTYQSQTYVVPTPGTATIPIVVAPTAPPAPSAGFTSATHTPIGPTSTSVTPSSTPVQVTPANGAEKAGAGFGAFVAAVFAMLL